MTKEDEGWRPPDDWRDFDWGDDDPDGGALVPARPKPLPNAPAMTMEIPIDV